jgi:hypothetical protein
MIAKPLQPKLLPRFMRVARNLRQMTPSKKKLSHELPIDKRCFIGGAYVGDQLSGEKCNWSPNGMGFIPEVGL